MSNQCSVSGWACQTSVLLVGGYVRTSVLLAGGHIKPVFCQWMNLLLSSQCSVGGWARRGSVCFQWMGIPKQCSVSDSMSKQYFVCGWGCQGSLLLVGGHMIMKGVLC